MTPSADAGPMSTEWPLMLRSVMLSEIQFHTQTGSQVRRARFVHRAHPLYCKFGAAQRQAEAYLETKSRVRTDFQADPASDVSRLVAERGGFDLMPEQGCRPTNKYLPPRARSVAAGGEAPQALADVAPAGGFFAWVDRVLSD